MAQDLPKIVTRRAFRTGRCLALALPKAFAAALRIQPGTDLTVQIRDRALIVSRAVVTSESPLGVAAIPAVTPPSRTEDR